MDRRIPGDRPLIEAIHQWNSPGRSPLGGFAVERRARVNMVIAHQLIFPMALRRSGVSS
jgi:hypothetical protein